MAESPETHENIAYVRTHVDNLERMVRFQIAANPGSKTAVSDALSAREGSAEVYMALENGPRTQAELVSALGKTQSTISKIVSRLYDAGLIFKIADPRGSKQGAYMWSDLEQLLGVSRIARKKAGRAVSSAGGSASADT